MSQIELADNIEINFGLPYQGTELESQRVRQKHKRAKKEKNYDENSLHSLINMQDQLLISLRKQITNAQQFQQVVINEIKIVDKHELIKEFGQLDKKKTAVTATKSTEITKRDTSPNLELAKIEARKEYFMKRLRMNIEKMTVL